MKKRKMNKQPKESPRLKTEEDYRNEAEAPTFEEWCALKNITLNKLEPYTPPQDDPLWNERDEIFDDTWSEPYDGFVPDK